jgi:DNA polymerase III epsilon subunit-like protein
MPHYYLISIDCESTGLSVYNDQIVEFGAAIRKWNTETGEVEVLTSFSEYARPTVARMSKKAAEITGISQESLQNEPVVQEVFNHFLAHINTVCDEQIPRLLLSYNGFRYDIPLMTHELERCKESYALTYFRKLRIDYTIDMLPVCRASLDKTTLKRKATGTCSYKLGDVYSSVCKCPLENAHGALVDSVAVLDILRGELLETFTSLVCSAATTSDDSQCKNPMTLIRSIVTKGPNSKRKNGKMSSKRVHDMIRVYKRKKTN